MQENKSGCFFLNTVYIDEIWFADRFWPSEE